MNVGLLVGCSHYADPIPSLRYGASDAVAFGETLRTTCGVEDDALAVLHDDAAIDTEKPRFTNVLRLLSVGRERFSSARVDTLFFFFSGHGYHSLADGNQYLLLSDSVTGALESTSLSLQALVARLQEWGPRHLVLFIDACREPVAEHRGPDVEEAPALDVNRLLPAGNITFSSCSQGERSYEHPDVQGGFFTVSLCEALSDRGRCRTLHEVNAYVQERVPQLCAAHGKPAQQPTARLEPAEVLALDIVSESRRNEWRTQVRLGKEQRFGPVRPRDVRLQGVPAVGIDLGTCTSLIGVLGSSRQVEVLPTVNGRGIVPSVVNFDRDLNYVVGWEALDADRTRPEGTVFYPKRGLGTATQYAVHNRSLTPELVCSLILRSIRRNAEEHLGCEVPSIVASYPAAFGIAQVNALREAFRLAGWPVARMVSEPAAVGLLPLQTIGGKDDLVCLVIDLGGGTLDVSIIDVGLDEGDFQWALVRSAVGDGHLGGLDYDDVLIEHVKERLTQFFGTVDMSAYVQAAIRREVMRAKAQLSQTHSAVLVIEGLEIRPGHVLDVPIHLDRSLMAALSSDLDARVLNAVDLATVEAGIVAEEIDCVLLTGQATKLGSLRSAIAVRVPAPIVDDYQDDAVVRSVTRLAGTLSGQDMTALLMSATNSGIGVMARRDDRGWVLDESRDREPVPILWPHATIPTKRSEVFSADPGKTGQIAVHVVELRPWTGAEALPIGTIELDLNGPSQLEINVDVDANDVALLDIRNLSSGETKEFHVSGADDGSRPSIRDLRLSGSIEESQDFAPGPPR